MNHRKRITVLISEAVAAPIWEMTDPIMTITTRPWLPILAFSVCAAGLLTASDDSHKKQAEHAPAAKEAPKADAHKAEAPKADAHKAEAKKEAPKPTPAAPPVAKPAPTPPTPVRTASIRRAPVRKPAVTHRVTAPVTVTASPEPAMPPAPSTAVIHLVTHSAGSATASGFPIPDEVAKLAEERDKTERAKAEWARVERERQEMERQLAELERTVSAREAAMRQPEPGPEAEPKYPPVMRKRVDRNVLTNEGLVRLADSGYDEVFLMELIRRKPAKFDTTVEGLSYLMRAGLSQQLVRTVLAVEEWERARRTEELATAAPPPIAGGIPPAIQPPAIPAGMKEVKQKVMVPDGQLRAGERGVMMLAPSGERWYWVPDGANR